MTKILWVVFLLTCSTAWADSCSLSTLPSLFPSGDASGTLMASMTANWEFGSYEEGVYRMKGKLEFVYQACANGEFDLLGEPLWILSPSDYFGTDIGGTGTGIGPEFSAYTICPPEVGTFCPNIALPNTLTTGDPVWAGIHVTSTSGPTDFLFAATSANSYTVGTVEFTHFVGSLDGNPVLGGIEDSEIAFVPTSVPEPSSIHLLGLGLLAAYGLTRSAANRVSGFSTLRRVSFS